MNTWKHSKRGGKPKALAMAIGKVTKPIFGKRGFADGAIVNDWNLIVGDHLGAHSAPERITYPLKETSAGTLHLRVDNGGLGLELQHLEPQLIERINGYFGYHAVARIKITQGPLPERPVITAPSVPELSDADKAAVKNRLRHVKDAELSEALQALGQAVTGLRNSEKD